MWFSEPDERFCLRKKIFSKAARFLQIEGFGLLNLDRVAGPDPTFVCRVMQRKKSSNIRRPREIQQTRGRAVILHQREPLKIIIPIRNVLEKMNGLAFEDAQDAFFLVGPCATIDVERNEISRERAEQWGRSIALSAKCPVLVRRVADDSQVIFPRLQPYHRIRRVLELFSRRSHRY